VPHKTRYARRPGCTEDQPPQIINAVCSLTLLGEVIYGREFWHRRPERITNEQIGAMAGLSEHEVRKIIVLNDGSNCRPHTFVEIAHLVRGWLKGRR
jgi:hypothetical protein